jgi:hypothetical protein
MVRVKECVSKEWARHAGMSMTSITTKTAVQGLRQDQPRITRRTLSSKLGRKTVAAPIEVASPAAAVMANAVPNVCADVCVWVEGSMSRSKCNGVREQLKKQVWLVMGQGGTPIAGAGSTNGCGVNRKGQEEGTGDGRREEGRDNKREWGCGVGLCCGVLSRLFLTSVE